MAKKLHYEQSGDNYKKKDFVKVIALKIAAKTHKNLKRFAKYGVEIIEDSESRGESAYRVSIKSKKPVSFQFVHVEESIGTKNIIADEMEKITGKTYYESVAIDNAATIFNDLSTSGAFPISFMLHVATFPNEWYTDNLARWEALIEGTAKACTLAGSTFGGGESATDRDIIMPGRALLSGSATGIILNEKNVLREEKLTEGDRIVLFESSGVHANGITLLRRELLKRLPKGYKTKLPDGTTYGEALLTPTIIYSKLVEDLIIGSDIHYAVHITGHGWRKIMRAKRPFTYEIETIPPSQPIFELITKFTQSEAKDMYDTYNMGAGFAVFVPKKSVNDVLKIAKKNKIKAWDAGEVKKGSKKLIIKPLDLEFTDVDLQIR